MNKGHQTQLAKYGGVEGYRAEMKRRRSLVKNPGFASMDKDKHLAISKKGGYSRGRKAHEDNLQVKDQNQVESPAPETP